MLLAGGAAALAFLPAASIAWTIVPQLLAGAGMGLALPAYSGELLPERTVAEAARVLVARHVGIVVVLAILAPVATPSSRARPSGRSCRARRSCSTRRSSRWRSSRSPPRCSPTSTPTARAPASGAVERRRGDFADDAAVYDRLARASTTSSSSPSGTRSGPRT